VYIHFVGVFKTWLCLYPFSIPEYCHIFLIFWNTLYFTQSPFPWLEPYSLCYALHVEQPCWGSSSLRSWVVQNYFRFRTRISRYLSSSTLCKWRHDNVSSPWYCKTDLVRLCASFQGAYCDFVPFAEVQSAPALCSAYGPVRVLCSVKMVAVQRAYSVAFIPLHTTQQLTNSLLEEYNTKPHY
jgi:hypothetical protein